MFRIVCLLIGYAFGMIQTSYIIGRLSGIDIREHGSNSAGFTNTNRVLGMKKGAIVFFIDVAKAMLAFAVATVVHNQLFAALDSTAGGTFFASAYVLPGLYAGLGAILGHCFPFYLKFKGGKGVACLLGVIIMLDWRVIVVAFVVGLIAVIITRFISVASLVISLSVPISMLIFVYNVTWASETLWLTVVLCTLIWLLHRANIKRILTGTENKFSFKKKT